MTVVYYPELWHSIIRAAQKHFHETGEDCPHFKTIEVTDTGLSGSVVSDIKERMTAQLSIIFLPVTHSALHLKKEGLKILGAVNGTRDDIFVFRKKKKPDTYKHSPLKVGVKGFDITTTYALLLSLTHWDPDPIFGSLRQHLRQHLAHDHVYDRLHSRFRLVAVASGLERFRQLAGEELPNRRRRIRGDLNLDAAIFMGRELSVRIGTPIRSQSLFSNETIIDVVNLNRSLNTRYATTFFPRAVAVCFNDDLKNEEREREIRTFCHRWNTFVDTLQGKAKPDTKSAPSRTRLFKIGPAPDLEPLIVAITFLNDIFSGEVLSLRQHMATAELSAADLSFLQKIKIEYDDVAYYCDAFSGPLIDASVMALKEIAEKLKAIGGPYNLDVSEAILKSGIDFIEAQKRCSKPYSSVLKDLKDRHPAISDAINNDSAGYSYPVLVKHHLKQIAESLGSD